MRYVLQSECYFELNKQVFMNVRKKREARLSQCRIKVAEWSGLFVALVVAAAFSDVTSNAAWKRIWRAFTLWLDIWRTPDPTVLPMYGKPP